MAGSRCLCGRLVASSLTHCRCTVTTLTHRGKGLKEKFTLNSFFFSLLPLLTTIFSSWLCRWRLRWHFLIHIIAFGVRQREGMLTSAITMEANCGCPLIWFFFFFFKKGKKNQVKKTKHVSEVQFVWKRPRETPFCQINCLSWPLSQRPSCWKHLWGWTVSSASYWNLHETESSWVFFLIFPVMKQIWIHVNH